VEAACWLDPDRLLVVGHPDEEPFDGDDASLLAPGELGIWSLTQQAWTKRHRIDFRVGSLLGCQGRALATHRHLKLIAPATATVVAQWPELATGTKDASYCPSRRRSSPYIRMGPRAAVATTSAIVVIDLPP
jgi:hypothetical protein